MSDVNTTVPKPSPSPALVKPWQIGLALALLVGVGVSLFFLLKSPPAVAAIATDKEYWVSVASAEISAKTKDGKAWDAGNSGPDVYYEIWWQGNRVYKSSVCTDTLIAKWDAQEIDLTQILRTHRLEAAKSGAIIKTGKENKITIKLFDSDVTVNDLIEEYEVDISQAKGTIDLGPGSTKQCVKVKVLVAPVEPG